MDKTVYVLGAGFSMNAGAPSQLNILKEIFDFKNTLPKKKHPKIHIWIEELEKFIKYGLCVSDTERERYTLEDVYTPLDRSIEEGIPFRNYRLG